MTREEQIYSQSISYTKNIFGEIEDFSDVVDAFADGVRWADENPQFSKEEFIKKACEWMDNINPDDYMDSGIFQMYDMVQDFREAMEE